MSRAASERSSFTRLLRCRDPRSTTFVKTAILSEDINVLDSTYLSPFVPQRSSRLSRPSTCCSTGSRLKTPASRRSDALQKFSVNTVLPERFRTISLQTWVGEANAAKLEPIGPIGPRAKT